MPYRGYFALNGVEIANSSRVVAHLGVDTPTNDYEVFGGSPDEYALVEDPPGSGLYIPGGPMGADDGDGLFDPGDLTGAEGLYLVEDSGCDLVETSPGMWAIPDGSVETSPGLWTIPDGAQQFGPGLFDIDGCWGPAALCFNCSTYVEYDDTWDGLQAFLGDDQYRPELAPWFTSELPESGEFGGVWVLDVKGLDSTPIERPITQTVGNGAVAGPHRDASRTVTFEALLLACSNAGVEFGKSWLTGLLRRTNSTTDTRLRYLAASPAGSSVDPQSLLREARGVVLTQAPTVTDRINSSPQQNRHADMYRITWEMAVLSPYAYLPAVKVPVDWDRISRQPINWIHAADCAAPETCVDMPVMFSTECVPETIPVVDTPPPVCGGCMPVGGIDKYSFQVPTMDYAFRSRETAVTTVIKNTGEQSLTLQAFWRKCGADIRCDDNQWPLQVSGLPPGAELTLDGITGRFWAYYDDRIRRPVGVVGTPTGAPWQPPVIDRQTCWEFVVQTSPTAEFTTTLSLADREP